MSSKQRHPQRQRMPNILFFILLLSIALLTDDVNAAESADDISCSAYNDDNSTNDAGSSSCSSTASADTVTTYSYPDYLEYEPPPKTCRLFLAPRQRKGRKLGVYTAHDWKRGMPLTPRSGDLILHLIDVVGVVDVDPLVEATQNTQSTLSTLTKWYANGYLVDATLSGYGGNYEGLGRVFSVLPGVGMLADGVGGVQSTGGVESAGIYSDRVEDGVNTGHTVDGGEQKEPTKPNNPNDSIESKDPNVWAPIPETDEANLPRSLHPAAGSFALHYNHTFRVTSKEGLEKGSEIVVDWGGWHRDRVVGEEKAEKTLDERVDTQELFQSGLCLDNLHSGLSSHGLGRGAFASRLLAKGSVVAPVPVLPLRREDLRYLRSGEWKAVHKFRKRLLKEKNEVDEGKEKRESNDNNTHTNSIDDLLPPNMKWRQQLLLNYCFGHANSSVLLFPYGMHVNFINHAPSPSEEQSEEFVTNVGPNKEPMANVALRWSEKLIQKEFIAMNHSNATKEVKMKKVDLRTLTPQQLFDRPTPEGLVLEYVALRDIHPDEEIFFYYGSDWVAAWKDHVINWSGEQDKEYSPAYIMDDVVSNLRTAEEQLAFPYPDNVFTACFYKYEQQNGQNETQSDQSANANDNINEKKKTREKTEAIPWKMSRGLFDMINLRPCKVIDREPAGGGGGGRGDGGQGGGKMFYTAIIQNRPHLPPSQKIPKGEKHIVSGIPREAFRFVDRPYTSDVHLEGAFRKEIGLGGLTGNIFPKDWMDL